MARSAAKHEKMEAFYTLFVYGKHTVDGLVLEISPRKNLGELGIIQVTGEGHAYLDGVWGNPKIIADWVENAPEVESPEAASCISQNGRKAAWIDYIYVDPTSRGRGIGSKMLMLAMKYLKQLDVGQVWLLAEPESGKDRERLIGFYQRHGFGLAPAECRDERRLIMAAYVFGT